MFKNMQGHSSSFIFLIPPPQFLPEAFLTFDDA